MSITLNNSDFQCLQDQLVDLKTKNYELVEKYRRSQVDFEAAKAKICNLQLKLEEQERDFQVTSTTLRREIESVTSSGGGAVNDGRTTNNNNGSKDEEYKTRYKKLLHKAKELQQRCEKHLELLQQLDGQNKSLNEKVAKLDEENVRLREDAGMKQKQLDVAEKEYQEKLAKALEEHNLLTNDETLELKTSLDVITNERDELKRDIERLTMEVDNFDSKLEVHAEERRIQERKGIQIVKELKRQLASEKNRTETLQKRLENLLSEPPNANDIESGDRSRLSTSSSTNGNSNSSNGNGSRANQDANSVGSWSFVPIKTKQSSNQALNETISLCSINSEDRETVQQPCDTKSEDSNQLVVGGSGGGGAHSIDETSKHSISGTNSASSSIKQANSTSLSIQVENLKQNITSYPSYAASSLITNDGMLIEEQAALVERLTRLQHDKWMLEEKLSYMEQANSSLTEDLANKSDIIKHYFMEQAIKAIYTNHGDPGRRASFGVGSNNLNSNNLNSRRTLIPNNVNHLMSDQSSLKKVVNFLKEKSQVSSNETESICRETTKKMQLMLEETLIKCLKLQENLDSVTSELNKLKA